MSRYPLTVLLTWCLLAAPGSAGVTFGSGNAPKIQASANNAFSGRAMVTGMRWVDRKGRTVEQRLPFPVNLLESPGFVAPAGEWTDLELVLDGPVVLLAGGARTSLDLDVLAVPLELPVTGGTQVVVEFPTPDTLDADGLERALLDGALGRVR